MIFFFTKCIVKFMALINKLCGKNLSGNVTDVVDELLSWLILGIFDTITFERPTFTT